jgi:uncharacterized protein (TIRG00374 family)
MAKLNRSAAAKPLSVPPTDQVREKGHPLVLVGKIIIAGVLVLWMVRSGKLDVRDVARAIRHWPEMLVAVALCYVSYVLMALRWRILLAQQGIQASMRDVFALSMIGALFNTIIPGAVSGDVMKAYYVSARYRDKKAHAVTTILLDRFVGLTCLLILSAFAGAWAFSTLALRGRVAVLYWMVVIAAITAVVLPLLIIVMSDRINSLAEGLARRFPRLMPVALGVGAMAEFYDDRSVVAVAFLISFVGQLLIYLMLYVVGLSIGIQSIPVAQLLFVIPLGLTAMALPIAPAGLGVGQVVFYALFADLLPGKGPVGASIITIYQLVYVFVSLTGIIFYLSETSYAKKSRSQLNDAMPQSEVSVVSTTEPYTSTPSR